jgi:uncharacterized protein
MKLQQLPQSFSILKLDPGVAIPAWALQGGFFSVNRTKDELSMVCETKHVPPEIELRSDNWTCLKVEGLLDFAQTGILSSIAGPLAKAKISIFAVSTFNTDYILVKAENLARAKEALRKSGVTTKGSTDPSTTKTDLD